MNEIVPVRPMNPEASALMRRRGVPINTLDDLFRFAEIVHKARLCPTGIASPEAAFVAMEYGLELGLPPMLALQTIWVYQNRPSIFGGGFLGVCQSHPEWDPNAFKEWEKGTPKQDDWTAFCQMGRKGCEPMVREYSWADAREAGLLGKDNWKKHPRRMLTWRARTYCGRDCFADKLAGIPTREEIEELDAMVTETRPLISAPRRLSEANMEQTPLPPVSGSLPAPTSQSSAAPTQTRQPSSNELARQGTVTDVTQSTGANKKTGKPWTKYFVTLDGTDKFSTFDKAFADTAKANHNGWVSILYAEGKYGNDIVDLQPIDPPDLQMAQEQGDELFPDDGDDDPRPAHAR